MILEETSEKRFVIAATAAILVFSAAFIGISLIIIWAFFE